MKNTRPIHPDFQSLLDLKSKALIELFRDLRSYILQLAPYSIELLYHTHALTAVFSVQSKAEYRNPGGKALIQEAIHFALKEMDKPTTSKGLSISKIK